ncbi:MAG: hypothetical protein IPM13_04745 [Phycisphaerales bacterium]|nr:hypothetical protein [Phycisphaerales bacterium]
MNTDREQLEHLITRVLDGEATATERAALHRRLDADPLAKRLFEEHRALDALAGEALRAAAGRSASRRQLQFIQLPWVRYGLGAVAAAAAILIWLSPQHRLESPAREAAPEHASVANWLRPGAFTADVVAPLPASFERPQVKVRGSQQDYIVLPADQPGTYWIIEVDREQTHAIRIYRDY